VRELSRVAVYRRRVAGPAERVWENVRDWEHLPWLHRASFRSIALEEEGVWGWRARVGLQPDRPGNEIRLELRLDPAAPRYLARTLEGPGAGSEIWTRVTAAGASSTAIEVEFWLPGVSPAQAEAVGAAYTQLYRRLWDEDESMIVRRAERADTAASRRPQDVAERAGGLDLGHEAALRARLPLCVEHGGSRWRIVEVDGALVVHATVCPHWLGPLDAAPVEAGVVTCPWHGWRFDVRSGRRVGGEGVRARLAVPPRLEVGGDGVARLVDGPPPSRLRNGPEAP
jgi:nitrite reductase/ring-hydroxylating ferredoxin subunit